MKELINIDELIEKAADLYIREEDKQIRAEIEELNDFIKCSQKSHQKDGLPTEQTLKDFLSNSKDADELREKEKQKQ